jgi:hypothetical protein
MQASVQTWRAILAKQNFGVMDLVLVQDHSNHAFVNARQLDCGVERESASLLDLPCKVSQDCTRGSRAHALK